MGEGPFAGQRRRERVLQIPLCEPDDHAHALQSEGDLFPTLLDAMLASNLSLSLSLAERPFLCANEPQRQFVQNLQSIGFLPPCRGGGKGKGGGKGDGNGGSSEEEVLRAASRHSDAYALIKAIWATCYLYMYSIVAARGCHAQDLGLMLILVCLFFFLVPAGSALRGALPKRGQGGEPSKRECHIYDHLWACLHASD